MVENKDKKVLNVPNKRELTPNQFDTAEHKEVRLKRNVPNLRFKEFEGEWKECRLGEIMNFSEKRINTSTLTTSNYISTENMLQDFQGVIEGQSVPNNTNVISFTYGDILISNIRPYLKKVWKASIDGGCSSDVLVMKANDKINNDYLHYVIANNQFINFVMNGAKGVKMPRGDKEQMKTYIVSLPTMVKEQNKIAKFLSLLDERIATQNKIIDKLESLIKGLNQKVFDRKGIILKLGDICNIKSGYSGNQIIKGELKVSRIETISNHRIDLERVGFVENFKSSENYKLQVGDILFSNINSVEYIGNTAFVDKDYNLYHGMNLLRLIPRDKFVIPFYLYLLLNTKLMLNYFKRICNKAVSQASINQTELGKTIVNITYLEEQKQICNAYQTLYKKIENEKSLLSTLYQQKQYLLRQMFI